LGTVPAWAAAIAASLTSMQASVPLRGDDVQRSLKNCIDRAEPQVVSSFHRRLPAASKQ
jgi:hypothetical protein